MRLTPLPSALLLAWASFACASSTPRPAHSASIAKGSSAFVPVPSIRLVPRQTASFASLTLEECVAQARANRPSLAAAREFHRALLEAVDGAGALPDPRFSWKHFFEQVETRVGPQHDVLSISQSFPVAGRLELSERAAGHRAERAQEAAREVELEVVMEATEAWYDAYLLERSIDVVRRGLELVRYHEEVAQARYATTSGTHRDLVRAQLEQVRLDDRLRSLEDHRTAVRARLHAAMGIQPSAHWRELGPIPANSAPPPVLDLQDFARRNSPRLAGLERSIEEARARVELAERARWPNLALGVDWIRLGEARSTGVAGSGDDPFALTLSFGLPLSGRAQSSARREKRALLRSTVLEREEADLALSARIESALWEIGEADRRLELYGSVLIPKTREELQATEAAFRTGQADYLDLVQIERELLELELTLERTRAERGRAWAALEREVGGTLGGQDGGQQ